MYLLVSSRAARNAFVSVGLELKQEIIALQPITQVVWCREFRLTQV